MSIFYRDETPRDHSLTRYVCEPFCRLVPNGTAEQVRNPGYRFRNFTPRLLELQAYLPNQDPTGSVCFAVFTGSSPTTPRDHGTVHSATTV